jgi:hypothetical protein
LPRQIIKLQLLFFLLFLALAACPQAVGKLIVRHGTVVVIFFSKDHVVLAADSRRTFSGGRHGYEDNQCKVSDLGQATIFAGSGVSGYNFGPEQTTGAFDTYKAALNAARSLQSETPDRAKATADGWSKRVKMSFDEQLARRPEEIITSLHGSSKLLAGGVFAGKTSSGLVVYFAAVNCECSGSRKFSSIHMTELHPTDDGLPIAAIGTSETQGLFGELVDGSSQRALVERALWPMNLKVADYNIDVTIRTAEFILRTSKDRTIGGSINAVELGSDGQVRWIKKEKFCK